MSAVWHNLKTEMHHARLQLVLYQSCSRIMQSASLHRMIMCQSAPAAAVSQARFPLPQRASSTSFSARRRTARCSRRLKLALLMLSHPVH